LCCPTCYFNHKAKVSKFGNYWLQHSDLKKIVENSWNILASHTDNSKRIDVIFKNLRRGMKLWAKSLSFLKDVIQNVSQSVDFLDVIEETRRLSSQDEI
jgi:hypothetical protein